MKDYPLLGQLQAPVRKSQDLAKDFGETAG